jgi:hypothetical protein
MFLRPKSPNRETLHHLGFEDQPRNRPPILRPNREKLSRTSFEAKLEKTVTTGFESKPPETVAIDFDVKPAKIVATDFEVKPVKTVRVVLRQNHSQIVDIGFKAQPRNSRSSSARARCTPHTTPVDLSICATIPGPLHQVSYFCHDPHRCTSYRT